MHPELASRFENLEHRRRALVKRVNDLSPEQQKAKPGDGFSPVEVIMHMALAEQNDVDQMRKVPPSQLKDRKPKPSFIFRKAVKDMAAAKPVRTFGPMIPQGEVELDEASAKWQTVREEIARFLDEAEGPSTALLRFFPFGTLSGSDLLTLLEAHSHYHEMRFPHAAP